MSKNTTKLPQPLSAGDVGSLFGVDPKTVSRWADEGKIPSFRTPGGHRRFNLADLEPFLHGTPQPA